MGMHVNNLALVLGARPTNISGLANFNDRLEHNSSVKLSDSQIDDFLKDKIDDNLFNNPRDIKNNRNLLNFINSDKFDASDFVDFTIEELHSDRNISIKDALGSYQTHLQNEELENTFAGLNQQDDYNANLQPAKK